MTGPLVLIHSTEGSTAKGAAAWLRKTGNLSHEVYDPATDETITLLPWYTPARSLRNEPGGVETNRRTSPVYQVEVVGYAQQIPGYGDTWYANLAGHISEICDDLGVPKSAPKPFKPYPASYGPNNGVRFTEAEWEAAEGICGHLHAPENRHGDPGDISRLFPLLNGTTPMGMTAEQQAPYIRRVQEAILSVMPDGLDPYGPDEMVGPTTATAVETMAREYQELAMLNDTSEADIADAERWRAVEADIDKLVEWRHTEGAD